MEATALLIFLLIGAIAGWLAGIIMQGGGFGLIGNIIVGVLGAFIGGWILPRLGISVGGGMIDQILSALVGAVILLFILGLIRR